MFRAAIVGVLLVAATPAVAELKLLKTRPETSLASDAWIRDNQIQLYFTGEVKDPKILVVEGVGPCVKEYTPRDMRHDPMPVEIKGISVASGYGGDNSVVTVKMKANMPMGYMGGGMLVLWDVEDPTNGERVSGRTVINVRCH